MADGSNSLNSNKVTKIREKDEKKAVVATVLVVVTLIICTVIAMIDVIHDIALEYYTDPVKFNDSRIEPIYVDENYIDAWYAGEYTEEDFEKMADKATVVTIVTVAVTGALFIVLVLVKDRADIKRKEREEKQRELEENIEKCGKVGHVVIKGDGKALIMNRDYLSKEGGEHNV